MVSPALGKTNDTIYFIHLDLLCSPIQDRDSSSSRRSFGRSARPLSFLEVWSTAHSMASSLSGEGSLRSSNDKTIISDGGTDFLAVTSATNFVSFVMPPMIHNLLLSGSISVGSSYVTQSSVVSVCIPKRPRRHPKLQIASTNPVP